MATKTKWILIVAGGILQLPAVRAAHELGYQVVVSDRDLDCACAGVADHFVEMDTFDVDGHVEFVRNWSHGLAAVFTAAADPIVTVAKTAAAAGCHGVPVVLARWCADKDLTRHYLPASIQPKYMTFWDTRHLDTLDDDDYLYNWHLKYSRFGEFVRAPFIVKALRNSGSRGHTRLDTDHTHKDFVEAYYRARAPGDSMVLIEELLTGIELSAETLWYNGIMIPLNAVERVFSDDPNYAIELGHYNPYVGDADTYTAVWDVMEQAGHAIGMGETQGGHILKGDLMLTDDGPKVLELTTRLSGGFDSGWTSPLAHGVDYTKGALLLALGEPLEVAMPYFTKRWHRHAACWAVFGPKEGGIIKSIRGLDGARKFCDEVILRFNEGDTLPPLTDCGARVAFCIAEGQMMASGARLAAFEIEVILE